MRINDDDFVASQTSSASKNFAKSSTTSYAADRKRCPAALASVDLSATRSQVRPLEAVIGLTKHSGNCTHACLYIGFRGRSHVQEVGYAAEDRCSDSQLGSEFQ